MNFGSDNVAAVHPAIMQALADANTGNAPAYGGDAWTARLASRLSEIFETDVAVFPVATGTAANSIALSVLSAPTGVVYCHDHAHVFEDECGAPEFYTGGAKLFALGGPEAGKLGLAELERGLGRFRRGFEHHQQPSAVTLTQSSEWGTVYGVDEVRAIAELAHAHHCAVHMDGARFANALVALDVSPAELTWRAGVDVMSFGATKNGAMAAEAVIFFDPAKAADFRFRRKRGGHLFSKMRYLSAQLLAYLEDDLWLSNARHANEMAKRLNEGLSAVPGVHVVAPVEANEIFVRLPEGLAARLRAEGAVFHDWPAAGPNGVRLVTSFMTEREAVDAFVAACRGG